MDEERAERLKRSYFMGRQDAMNGDEHLSRERIISDPRIDLDPDEYERGYRSYQEEEE